MYGIKEKSRNKFLNVGVTTERVSTKITVQGNIEESIIPVVTFNSFIHFTVTDVARRSRSHRKGHQSSKRKSYECHPKMKMTQKNRAR